MKKDVTKLNATLASTLILLSFSCLGQDLIHGRLKVDQIHGYNDAYPSQPQNSPYWGDPPTKITVIGGLLGGIINTTPYSDRGDIAIDFMPPFEEEINFGIPIVTIAEHQRDNSSSYAEPAPSSQNLPNGGHFGIPGFFKQVSPATNDYMLATFTANDFPSYYGPNHEHELNVNVNVAYFLYSSPVDPTVNSYLAGHIHNENGGGFRGHPDIQLGSELINLGDTYLLNLTSHHYNACDGILLANSGSNSPPDLIMVRPDVYFGPNMEGFEIMSYRAPAGQLSSTPYFGFVFIPKTFANGVIARYRGDGKPYCIWNQYIVMSKIGTGTYYLRDEQTGLTPKNSTLLLTPLMNDIFRPRLLAAEPDEDWKGWIIEVREMGTGELLDINNGEVLVDLAILPDNP